MAGQLARLHDPRLIREVISILAVEAGHAAALERLSRAAVGGPMPVQGVDGLRPGAFERPLERDDVPRLLERVGIEL